MSKLLWVTVGVALGFALAHVVDKSPRGHAALAQADGILSAFCARAVAAYRLETDADRHAHAPRR